MLDDFIHLFFESAYAPVVWSVVAVAVAAGCLSPLVVMNRMSFFTDAVAHSSLLGVAAGLALGLDPDASSQVWPMLAVSLAVGLAVWWLKLKTPQSLDTLLGVMMVGALALGVLLYRMSKSRRDLDSYLFGSLTTIPASWCPWIIAACVLVAFACILLFNKMALTAVSRDLLRARGAPAAVWEALLVGLLAAVVTLGVRTVGILMVNALLVVPGAASRNLARRLGGFFWISAITAGLSAVIGLTASYSSELPPGPTIVVVAVCLFAVSLPLGALLRKLRG